MLFLVLAGVFLFFLRAAYMYYGQMKSKSVQLKEISNVLPFVSIIVPARNEEKNIIRCIEALQRSNYPSDKFEIIAINDRSTDSTQELLDNLAQKYSNLIPIHLTESSKKGNLKGKPGALKAGIEAAKGEYLLMTDADCAVNPNWIRTISERFTSNDLNLIPSFTLIEGEKLFDKIQALEWIYMHTMASAGLAMNNPLGCFGNNLSVKKEIYDSLGGYENIKFSVTEDLALLRAVHSNHGKIHYLCERDATVTTYPEKTFSDYIKQHRRWALGGLDLGFSAAFFVVASLGIWSAIILSFLSGFFALGFGILTFRVIADSTMIASSINKLKLEKSLYLYLIPSVLFFMAIELIMPFLMINKTITWKGQVFSKS